MVLGSKPKNTDILHELFVDDLLAMWHNGFQCWDSNTGKVETLRAMLGNGDKATVAIFSIAVRKGGPNLPDGMHVIKNLGDTVSDSLLGADVNKNEVRNHCEARNIRPALWAEGLPHRPSE
ncbi:hypothetical protein CYMTET_5311 [Cymbomonas tetramitiformis]|uniref:Uncharacterized protein n=1 Tax=Cymbomonas tetramitiformis TaxID=36881 RepID=A0AAE0LJL3_9CHLO|nr:hypothetical protein CYMTET_5311 [Cymbomonas tetramitiformis]